METPVSAADMHPSSFRYILRYQIDPGWEPEARLEELVQLCRSARVEEVMLLFQAEELSTGMPVREEWDVWIDLGRKVAARLAREGIALSLNPWTTLLQVPRGRRRRPGQTYRAMRGETGGDAPLAACPLCPEWRQDLTESFSRLARELRPVAIWVEDDWRLHNHGPELAWGGCFCEEHLRRFSEAVGEAVTLEALLDKLLRPGPPHPWRAIWLNLSRESLLEPMHALRKAVTAANPGTRLGLMSSRPDQHSIEGRNWSLLQEAVGQEPEFLIRPHMEPYTESRALRVTAAVTRQTIACLQGPLGIYPELENSPRCGIYSKSAAHTVWQMLEAAAFGAPGITINHYDNMGCGLALDPDLPRHLAAAKPRLSALAALGVDDRLAAGAQVLFSTRIASDLELPAPAPGAAPARPDPAALSLQMQMNPSGGGAAEGSMQSLLHPSTLWGEICAILGIAHRFTETPDPAAGPVLVNGQTLRTLDDEQIRRLLGGCVLLDAVALEVLCARGFAGDLHVRGIRWHRQEDSAYSYETLLAGSADAYGIANPRVCAQRVSGRVLEIDHGPECGVLSRLHRGDGTPLWPGAILCPTPQGGRIIALTYPLDGGGAFFMSFFTRFRRVFLRHLLLENAPGAPLLFGPDGCRVYRQPLPGGRTLVAVLNSLLDPLDDFTLHHSPRERFPGTWRHLDADGVWQPVQPAPGPGQLHLDLPVPALQGVFLLYG